MSTAIVGSNEPQFASDQLKPSKRGYGQNGFAGASSDVPGDIPRWTQSGFLPPCDITGAVNNQTRKLVGKPVPTTFGMHKPKTT